MIKPSVDGQWVALITSARNGQTIFTSETYKSQASAKRAVYNLVRDLFNCESYQIETQKRTDEEVKQDSIEHLQGDPGND